MRRFLAVAVSILIFFSATSAGRTQTVTVRATSALSDQAVQYLAGVSKPKELTIPAGVKPETFMRAFCGGGLSNTYQEEFYKLNGVNFERAPVNRPRNVLVPGCVQWARDAKVPLRPNDTIDTVIQREIGTDSEAVLKPCGANDKDLRCNKTIRQLVRILNPDLNLDDPKDAKQVVLPVVSKFTTIQLNEAAPPPETVVNQLEKLTATTAAAPPNVQAQAAAPGVEDIELIKPLNFVTGFVDKSDCSTADPNAAWPINEGAVLAALARNRLALEAAGATVKPARIAVLDTGVELPSAEIPVQLLERNLLEVPNNNVDDDRNGFIDDVYGIDARGLGKIAPAANYEAAEHGWYVADLATGGVRTRQQQAVLAQHLRLKVVNLVLADQNKFEIREGSILRGLQYASSYADIVNLSVGSPNSMDNVVTAARGYPNLLLVIAAGNRGQDLNIKPLYPAFFGGQLGRLQDQAITVAAHGPDGRRANFSNFSSEYVDIAAPGCAIVQTSRQGASVKNFGTSVAAPYVSFTAALIKSLGIENPNAIKNRLIASSRYVPKLDGLVVAAGILDPVKAVSIYEDVVERSDKNAPWLTGKWRRQNFVKLCSDRDELEANRVRKVTVPPQDASHIRVLYENDDHRVRPFFCSPAGPGIMIDQTTGDTATIPWSELFDFVPGMRLT
ncbi:S8 family serine peptidase [Bradyrhizobium genosp. A]|uniref:S8 family serine peptidase n=1 Tax=Bradyrhizobium genosp. A TaxID=83626 RepID=UPI003CF0BD07